MLAQTSTDTTAAAGLGSLVVLLLVVAALFYFVPSVIAIVRHHSQTIPIVAVNILLGWTFLGWVVAFIWSLSADKPPLIVNQTFGSPAATFATPQKLCQHCQSAIPYEATVCRFCRRDVADAAAHDAPAF
jgi:hypothetical protein